MFNDPSLKCSLKEKTDRYKAVVVTPSLSTQVINIHYSLRYLMYFQSLDEKRIVNLATSVPDLHLHRKVLILRLHTLHELECFLINLVVIKPKYTKREKRTTAAITNLLMK